MGRVWKRRGKVLVSVLVGSALLALFGLAAFSPNVVEAFHNENGPPRTRGSFIQEDLAPYAIPWTAFRKIGAGAALLPGVATATPDLGLVNSAVVNTSPFLETADCDNNAVSEPYSIRTQFAVPPEYVAGQTITIRFSARMNTTVADNAATIDVKATEWDDTTTDICTTSAQDMNTLTPTDYDFTILPTDVAVGDLLDVELTLAVQDDGVGGGVVKARTTRMLILLDIKG